MLQNRIKALRDARENGESGFTLIELLIVIVVLGILASIVVFGVATFRDDAETAACEADVKTVNVASSAYNAATGAPATDVAELVTDGYLAAAPTTTIGYDNTTGVATATC